MELVVRKDNTMKLFGKKAQPKKEEPKMQEAVLTLYACRKDVKTVPDLACRLFSEVMDKILYTDEDEFHIQFKDGTGVQFHLVTDAEETEVQSKGMASFFSQAPLENEAVKDAALCQICLFNCIIGIRFEIDGDSNRTNYIVNTIYGMAGELSAFVLYPNMYLYHWDGRLLLSIDGKSDFEEFYPQASTTILDREEKEKEADRERKMRSIAILKEKGIPYLEHLKASVFEAECIIPDKEVVVHRLACTFAACVQSEIYTSGQFENCAETAAEEIAQLEKNYQISEWLSTEERDYLENPDKDPALHNRFGWRYECCSVLLWALSMIELKEPTEICNASELGAIMWNHTFDSLMEASVLRSRDEILDMQDLVLRYDWACVDARIHHRELPMLSGDIIYEWHYALNWLVQADGIADWDRVITTT